MCWAASGEGVCGQLVELPGSHVFSNYAGAGFNDGPGNWYANGCSREAFGACTVVLCDLTNGGDELPAPGATVSAGSVTIGGTTPAFSLTYDAITAEYTTVPAVPSDHLLLAGGETITFSAAGADAPAFTATLVAPSRRSPEPSPCPCSRSSRRRAQIRQLGSPRTTRTPRRSPLAATAFTWPSAARSTGLTARRSYGTSQVTIF